jgi:hypothetical protein
VVTWVIKFCTVVHDIFSIIIVFFFLLHKKMCAHSHDVHNIQTRKKLDLHMPSSKLNTVSEGCTIFRK